MEWTVRTVVVTSTLYFTVVEADRSCVVQVSTSPVHISSRQHWTTSTDGRCGSVDQPWTLRAPTGQHIRVHLLDFAADVASDNSQDDELRSDSDGRDGCREYGHVDEMLTSVAAARRRQTVICGDHRRDKLILESNSNVIHIVFNRQTTNSTDFNFLLRFYGDKRSRINYVTAAILLLNNRET